MRPIIFITLLLVFLFSGMPGVTAGTYIYYNKKGERVRYLPKEIKKKQSVKKIRVRDNKKDKSAGVPYSRKDKKDGKWEEGRFEKIK